MRDSSQYAGTTQRLRADAAELGGFLIEVVDWYQRTGTEVSWRDAIGIDPRAEGYNLRHGLGGLPDDDEVLFGRVDGMGQLVHLSEIEGAAVPEQPRNGPSTADRRAVGLPCPACQVPIADGDQVAMIPIGPGANAQARANARAGQPYEAVIVELHWACATGDESYSTSSES